jgi:hypothetical protein
MTFYATEQEAIAAAHGTEVDEFEGMNCNDIGQDEFCTGWDGESRRCDCGNRRVQWLGVEVGEGKWLAYAEAY